ncbi:MAG TPA: DedA family protein [Vicinamibacterales bacterium]|nr:DedA family protein [Vicinamibacterales bacterium]
MDPALLAWLSQYGPIALFVLLMLGIFGLPVPDETLLVVAGTLVGKGELPLGWTFGAAVAGSSIGISLSYLVGRVLGPPAVRAFGRLVHVSEQTLARIERWFERIGKWTLTFGYYVPGVRHITAIVAGASRLPAGIFMAFAYSGAILWSATFLWLGYEVGDNWPVVLDTARRHIGLAAAAAIVITVAWAWWRNRTGHERRAGRP